MNSEYGSEWRKWDFHIHTPYSILNNKYDLRVGDPGVDDTAAFDQYVQTLFRKAIEKDIWAIGITDYFTIDGYKRIREKYLSNPAKMEELFPNENDRERIGQIFVFPNIEMRLDKFVVKGGSNAPIGYHVLFSDSVDPSEIEGSFLHCLSCRTDPAHTRSLNHEGITAIGQQIKRDNQEKGDDYRIGLEHVTVDDKEILEVLKSCTSFEGKYLITVPVDEDLSSVRWSGRDYLVKKNIYQQCHCYMTSNEGTRKWALAAGEEEERKREFGSIKPCIWGSDAHSFNRMFEPGAEDRKAAEVDESQNAKCNHRYCWVKADPTFEGLMQILCEPADRIRIQENRPEPHDMHRSIESIQFRDENFQMKPIRFSEALTCIIGGRSTGKSLLLRQLARAISPTYAQKQEERPGTPRLQLPTTATVKWRDGESGERKIIYLPQTYLNRTVDDPESNTGGASELIETVLLQNDRINAMHEKFESQLNEIKHRLADNLNAYTVLKNQLDEANKRLNDHGPSELFLTREKQLIDEYALLSAAEGASKEDMEAYSKFKSSKSTEHNEISSLKTDENILQSLSTPSIAEPFFEGFGCLGILTEKRSIELRNEIDAINNEIELRWNAAIKRILDSCYQEEESHKERLASIDTELESLEPKVECSGKLYKAMNDLNEERKRRSEAETIESEIRKLQKQIDDRKKGILESRQSFEDAYRNYCEGISPLSKTIAPGLDFSAEPVWKKGDFSSAIGEMLDGRKLHSFCRTYGLDFANLQEDDYTDDLLMNLWSGIGDWTENSSLSLRSAFSEDDFLRKLFDDWYNVHYVVMSGGDCLDKMSPGKKGLVLLELIIELEHGDCPILIDQPEDDLDNQSIYMELRRFIKESKKHRQIIIVTHNANIALGADAEEIIVANQNGAGRENENYKFEYRSGAIENDTHPDGNLDELAYLQRCGIQEHACQILDGGREALEQRQRKYSAGTLK